jgi:hypothetical protein
MRGPIPSRDEDPVISHELVKHDRPSMPLKAESTDRAIADAKRREAGGRTRQFIDAHRQLEVWTPATAVENIEQMGFHQQQVFLVAEEFGQARPMILRSFPKASPRVRALALSVLPVAADSAGESQPKRTKR